jgi:hypothetical protein
VTVFESCPFGLITCTDALSAVALPLAMPRFVGVTWIFRSSRHACSHSERGRTPLRKMISGEPSGFSTFASKSTTRS